MSFCGDVHHSFHIDYHDAGTVDVDYHQFARRFLHLVVDEHCNIRITDFVVDNLGIASVAYDSDIVYHCPLGCSIGIFHKIALGLLDT